MNNKWIRQNDKPLFEDLEWNKPERKDQAGRLLIVGGNVHALTAPAQSYIIAEQLGIGTQKVVLPSKTKSVIGDTPFDTLYLPSTPSGEFSKDGAQELLEYALWSDTVLLPGDTGRNSQTTMLLADLVSSFTGQIAIARDSLDTLLTEANILLKRPQTALILTIAELQKFAKQIGLHEPISFSMDLVKLVELLTDLTEKAGCDLAVLHQSQFIVASSGQVSTTKTTVSNDETAPWRTQFAATAACYLTWYPTKPFEALTHTAFLLK